MSRLGLWLGARPTGRDAARALLRDGFDEARVHAPHQQTGGVPVYLDELAPGRSA